MNFFKKKTCWSNLGLGAIKLCVGSLWLMVGVYFHEFLQHYLVLFGVLFIATALGVGYTWVKQMRRA
jgi:hypothetical protein